MFAQVINMTTNSTGYGLWFNNTINALLILSLISAIIPMLYKKLFINVYMIVGATLIVVLFYQSIYYYIYGLDVVQIVILPLPNNLLHYWNYLQGGRPSALFAEPQAYASYLLPLLIILIQKKKTLFALLLTISLILSTSSLGIIVAVIIWLGSVIYSNSKILVKMFIFIFIVMGSILIIQFPIFEYSIEKIMDINVFENIRLTRGFALVMYMDFNEFLFGLGAGEIQSFVISHYNELPFWVTTTSEFNIGYATTTSAIILQYGFISFITYIFMHYRNYKAHDKSMKIFAVILFVIPFLQTMLFSVIFIFYYLINYMNYDKNNDDYIYIKY
jgi:hypothetical protein